MRESVGSVALYNIIIVFIVVTFAVLAGTMSYSKAFKVNNRIINAIEKYEGYNNDFVSEEIDRMLSSIGYQFQNSNFKCSQRNGYTAMLDKNPNYEFCVYEMPVDSKEWNGRYFEYGVVSYIYIDLPVIGDFVRIPVYGVSRKIFKFEETNAPSVQVYKYVDVELGGTWKEFRAQNNGILLFDIAPSIQDIRENLEVFVKSSDGGSANWLDYSIKINEDKNDTSSLKDYKKCRVSIMVDGIDTSAAGISYYVKTGNCNGNV